MKIFIQIIALRPIIGQWNYKDVMDKIDGIETNSDLESVFLFIRKSHMHKILYSEYVKNPYVSIFYSYNKKIDNQIYNKIVYKRIQSLAVAFFYKISNGWVDIEFVRLILKTKIQKWANKGVGQYITISVAFMIRRFIILSLFEPFILLEHWNDIKSIYNPIYGYTEIHNNNDYNTLSKMFDRIDKDGPSSLNTSFDPTKSKINDLFSYEKIRLKMNVKSFYNFSVSESEEMIKKYASGGYLINYLFYFNGIRRILENLNEMISKYYVLLNEKGYDDARVSINGVNELFISGRFKVIENIYSPCAILTKTPMEFSLLSSLFNKNIIIHDRFEFDFFLSLIQIYTEMFETNIVLEIFKPNSAYIIKMFSYSVHL